MISISRDTLILLLDLTMTLPYAEVAPMLDRVYGEVGDQLTEESDDTPQIITEGI